MINPNSYFCPNCNKNFPINTSVVQKQGFITLDKNYNYIVVEMFCNNCNKVINGILLQRMTLWDNEYQYLYKRFVKNYLNKNNKNYLYAYFPLVDQKTIINLFKFINFDKFDAIVIPEYYNKFIQWDKQICILPNIFFKSSIENIYPNYLCQKLVINESQKFTGSKLYSIYNTFFYKFNSLYGLKKWQKLKLMIK